MSAPLSARERQSLGIWHDGETAEYGGQTVTIRAVRGIHRNAVIALAGEAEILVVDIDQLRPLP